MSFDSVVLRRPISLKISFSSCESLNVTDRFPSTSPTTPPVCSSEEMECRSGIVTAVTNTGKRARAVAAICPHKRKHQ